MKEVRIKEDNLRQWTLIFNPHSKVVSLMCVHSGKRILNLYSLQPATRRYGSNIPTASAISATCLRSSSMEPSSPEALLQSLTESRGGSSEAPGIATSIRP